MENGVHGQVYMNAIISLISWNRSIIFIDSASDIIDIDFKQYLNTLLFGASVAALPCITNNIYTIFSLYTVASTRVSRISINDCIDTVYCVDKLRRARLRNPRELLIPSLSPGLQHQE